MGKTFQKIKDARLAQDEKTQMLSVLNDFVKKNPINEELLKKQAKSPFYSGFFVLMHNRKYAAGAVFAIVFILTTGTAFGANSSLPGDILYPVKIFNENVKMAVSIGTKAKAQVSTERAISRLKEIEELAAKGTLTPEVISQVKIKLEEHSNNVQKNIDELKKSGNNDDAKEVSKQFESSINTQKENINKIVNDEDNDVNDEVKENLTNITSHVDEEIRTQNARIEEDSRTEASKQVEQDRTESRDVISRPVSQTENTTIKPTEKEDSEEVRNTETRTENRSITGTTTQRTEQTREIDN